MRAGGQRVPVDGHAAPIRDDAGAIIGVVLVFRDITGQQKMAEALRQSQKLQAVGRLAGGVAHEFNNLMTVVLGVSEIVVEPSAARRSARESRGHPPGR